MRRIRWILSYALLLSGCEISSPPEDSSSSGHSPKVQASSPSVTETAPDNEATSNSVESTNESPIANTDSLETPASLRDELDAHLASLDLSVTWTYGERKPGELAGVWISSDAEGEPIEFEVAGRSGAFSETFDGKLTLGLYAISTEGRIVTISRQGGVRIRNLFRFDGTTITGSSGPNPEVRWHRAP